MIRSNLDLGWRDMTDQTDDLRRADDDHMKNPVESFARVEVPSCLLGDLLLHAGRALAVGRALP